MSNCLNCGYERQPEDALLPLSPQECPYCGLEYGVKSHKKTAPFNYKGKKCLNCGYERTFADDQIVFLTECPKCLSIYSIVERRIFDEEQEREKVRRKRELKQNKRDGNQLTTGQAWLMLIVAITILTFIGVNKYNSIIAKQEAARQNSPRIDYMPKNIPLSLPPDMQKEIDMRRDMYEEARRGAQDALFEHDISRSRDFPLTLSQPLPNLNRGLDINDQRTRMEMEIIAEEAVMRDRMLHGRPPF